MSDQLQPTPGQPSSGQPTAAESSTNAGAASELDQQKQTYREEAFELLSELESALLELEETPDDQDLIGRVFRALHTIKGSGAMFGFDTIADFTHEVETVFDLVREGELAVCPKLINLALAAGDMIGDMLRSPDETTGENSGKNSGDSGLDHAQAADIIEGLKLLVQTSPSLPEQTVPPTEANDEEDQLPVTYRVRFRPAEDIFITGTNPLMLLDELRELGDCRVVAHTDAIPALDALDPEACYVSWDILLTTDKGKNAIEDVFIFVADDSDLTIEVIDHASDTVPGEDYKKLGEILIDRGDLSPEKIRKTLSGQKRLGEMLVEANLVPPDAIESALVEQQHVKTQRQKQRRAVAASSIRVDAFKLDDLVDLVGELVTVQARLSQHSAADTNPELTLISEEVERLTAELRDNTMSIRMLPIGTTFSKFRRLVRDLSQQLGKEVVITTEGGETELDKTVIDQLNDPLVHIIRNSVDHGIEAPDLRAKQGKPRQGTVQLSAVHSGANVLIQITDDGAGLDRQAILKKAVAAGLVAVDQELSDKEIFGLIFEAGFSTAESVTGVSGRGVGMDVVKRSIEALRGAIEVDSRPGQGTTITLRLPLTLAIIDGLMVEIGQGNYVVPLSAVEECIELTPEDVARAHGRHIANVRGEIVPYVPLRDFFHVEGDSPPMEQIVINNVDGQRLGIVVDHVIGEHQTVIKSLSKYYQNVEGVSGATIMGDGKVALILDVPKLMQAVETQERALH